MIRPAGKDDMEAVYRLIRQLSSHTFTKDQFIDCFIYNLENGCILVYEKDHFIRGCAAYSIHYLLHFSRKTAEIVNLVVDESCRGQCIGKELLYAIEQIAIEKGCVCIEVDSGKHRKDAHRFYEQEGFNSDHYKFTKGLL